ncbi:MAG TPA: hypothetical protein ACFYEK_14570 [Candidatus Wunengus sp. YC60]|uniref:hypothetical protein n=1 Tax=Candidatus Wunengus sp. YC60 TaxID=3367697 RepID=UPI004028CF18
MHFLDTCALVKLLLYDGGVPAKILEDKEPGSKELYEYIYKANSVRMIYTNSLCLAEALGIIKSKYFTSKKQILSFDGYLIMISNLKIRIKHQSLKLSELDWLADNNFEEAVNLVEKYRDESIDLVDALQIVDIKYGQYSTLKRKSQTLLITADKNLANAAKKEGVKVWYCINEPVPE